MDALHHPATLNVVEFKPPETVRRSPRLLRKPRPLKKAKSVDVSGMDVDPELARMLKSRKESSSEDEDETGRSNENLARRLSSEIR